MGCMEELQGDREASSCYVTSRREKAEEASVKDCPETKELWNTLETLEKYSSGSLFQIKTCAHPTALEY